MNKFWIIARDVYKKNVKSGAFLLMIALPFILLAIIMAVATFSGNSSKETDSIGIVSTNKELAQQLTAVGIEDYKLEIISSQKEAEKKLNDEKIEAFLVLDDSKEVIKGELFVTSMLGSFTELTISQLLDKFQQLQAASQLDLTAEQLASLSQPANFEKVKVSFDQSGKMTIGPDNTMVQMAISYVFTIILFMFISFYASIISQEIAAEKGSRIMEVILSSTTAATHFYGKLFGILLVILTQVVVYAGVLIIGISQLKNMDIVKEVLDSLSTTNIFGSFFYYTLAFLIIGIFIYSILAAICGSLVAKSEDTAKAVQPVMMLSMVGYISGLSLGSFDPQSIVIKVFSYIPFMSSYTMPIRLANEIATPLEVWISLIILIVFSMGLTLLATKFYKSNVLVYSDAGIWSALKQSITISKNERKNKKQ